MNEKKALQLLKQYPLMLCSLVDEPFDSPDWIFEPKLDGLRTLTYFDGKNAWIISRNGKLQNLQFPEIADELQRQAREPMILDGEIVCLDEKGASSFKLLQQRFRLQDPEEIARRMKQYPAKLFVFDLLRSGDQDLRSLPLLQRKVLLRDKLRWSDKLRFTDFNLKEGTPLFSQACSSQSEGIVAKRAESPYLGSRSGDWLKIKCSGRQEFVIGGFTDPKASRVGLGAILVGYLEQAKLKYAGKVGTGFTKEVLLSLRQKLSRLEQKHSPFHDAKIPDLSHVHWVKPKLIAEIAFAEWTQNELLRQPRFEGLRPDKSAAEIKRERPAPSIPALKLTSLDKIIFPRLGLTKADVIQFYKKVSPYLLPYLKDRPATLERLPDGLHKNGPHFWQKNTPRYYPSWIPRVRLQAGRDKIVEYTLVNSEEVLLYLVNQGCLTFHVWLSRVEEIEHPDWILFDLDPSGEELGPAIELAKRLRDALAALGKDAWIKTSGKAGLHLFIPNFGLTHDEARSWAERVAKDTIARNPGLATLERRIASRGNKVYLDVVQNAKGHHVVPPYVLRAIETAGVSTPLEWSELKATLDPKRFDASSILPRLGKRGDLFSPLLPQEFSRAA